MTVKVGQIREERNQKTKFVITYSDEKSVHCIDNEGICYSSIFSHELIEEISNIVAEYPTWLEAINSKEFKK